MAQVKFYATTAESYAAIDSKDNGGIYFVDGGELYKGTQRFGLGRVTVAASTTGIEGAARGDIVVTGAGAGWVFDGTNWQSIGGDVGSLTSAWRADISASLSGLAVGTATSYITNITQNADGSVTANAVAFPTLDTGDNDGEVKLGSDAAKVSGWDALKGRVSAIESIVDASNSTVTATTGSFTNLTVTSTATFSATTVSADTLTIGGSTVEQLADKQIAAIASHTETSTALGITVSVTTSAGSVSGVYVDATSFGNAMHFVGVKTSTGEVASPASGDIIVIGSNPATGFVAGQEYIYDGTNWELIGDQNTYALNAYAPGTETVTAGTTTLPAATHAIAAKVDTIAAALSDFTYSSVTGGSSSSTVNGVTVEVVNASTTAVPTVSLTGVGTAASVDFATTVTSDGTALPTQSAVATAIQNAALVWLDANGDAIA